MSLMPRLRGAARKLAGGHADLADDLVQDTVLLALRNWHRFTPGTDLKAWLFRILYNRFHSIVRRKYLSCEIAPENLELSAAVPPTQDVRLELAAFKRAFARLAPAHREALVLAGVKGLGYERIAVICGCKPGTVKSRVFRARELLKAMLNGDGESAAVPATTAKRPSKLVTPARTVPKLVPTSSIVVPAAAPLQAQRLPLLAETDRSIARAEDHVARHRRLAERLARVGMGDLGAEALLGLAERRLTLLRARRERLLLIDHQHPYGPTMDAATTWHAA